MNFPQTTLSILLMTAAGLEVSFTFQIKVIDVNKTWTEAREYCEEIGFEMIFIDIDQTLQTELGRILKSVSVWMGKFRDPTNSSNTRNIWTDKAISGNDTNWEPSDPEAEDCVLHHLPNNELHFERCNTKLPFICFDYGLVLVTETKNWEDAMQHCNDLCNISGNHCDANFNLMSPTRYARYNYIRTKMSSYQIDEVWTGLRFLGGSWFWLKGEESDWWNPPQCPSEWRNCGAVSTNEEERRVFRDCSERKAFFCIKEHKLIIVRVIQTGEEATVDPNTEHTTGAGEEATVDPNTEHTTGAGEEATVDPNTEHTTEEGEEETEEESSKE